MHNSEYRIQNVEFIMKNAEFLILRSARSDACQGKNS